MPENGAGSVDILIWTRPVKLLDRLSVFVPGLGASLILPLYLGRACPNVPVMLDGCCRC